MKAKFLSIPLALVLLLALALPAAAQDNNPALALRLSKDMGYAAGTDMQGIFSMRVSGPENMSRVVFFIDGSQIGEDVEAPFRLQFDTGSYDLGVHTLLAVGYTAGGDEIRSNQISANFVSSKQSMQTMGRILIPLFGLVLGLMLLSFVVSFATGKKAQQLPLGTPRNYGMSGGAICPRCQRPFALSFLSPNLGPVHRFARCPYCGKVGMMRRRSMEDLRLAEAREVEQAEKNAPPTLVTEEERLRKELENSRYHDL